MKTYRFVNDLWDDKKTAGFDETDLLIYRSNLLGSDCRITNTGGGNTSVKVMEKDPVSGKDVEVLWVKGSGGDLRTGKREHFASLYMDRLNALIPIYRKRKHEDVMLGYYPHCVFDLNPRACSIDTPLHAYVGEKHVDHTHTDAIIAIAVSDRGPEITREIFGDSVLWTDWQRPGFDLGMKLKSLYDDNPGIAGIVLGSHGLINWAPTAKECYYLTLDIIEKAERYWHKKISEKKASIFGGKRYKSLPLRKRKQLAAGILPGLRGLVSEKQRMIADFDDSPEVLEFVNSVNAPELVRSGTACADHYLRTKVEPLYVPLDKEVANAGALLSFVRKGVMNYRKRYVSYYKRNYSSGSAAIRDVNPTVILIPTIGMITFGKDKQNARITGEFYNRTIQVMKRATSNGAYTRLPEKEAFNIEYWSLEEAKLKRMPPEGELARKVVFITGAASGIGKVTAKRLAEEGAHVVVTDINEKGVRDTAKEIEKETGDGCALAIKADITDANAVAKAFESAILMYGGVDIVISNAGIASRGTVIETTPEDYRRLSDVIMKGPFLISHYGADVMKQQGVGGSFIFVASKNAVATSTNCAIFSAAKSYQLHLMRSIASDLGKYSIRSNAINPDAVLEGSSIWNGEWRRETAKVLGISPGKLEEHYRNRNLLKMNIYPEDCAEAILFLVSSRAGKTTGSVIPVDGGMPQAFLR